MSAATLSSARTPSFVDASQVPKRAFRSSWLQLLVGPIAIGLTQAPWWWETVPGWGRQGPIDVVALVPVMAALAGWRALRRDPRGRQIHDASGSLVPIDAWPSGWAHRWTLLIVVALAVIAALPRLFIHRPRSWTEQGPTARAAGRLTKAVPQGRRATYAVCALCAVLTVLTARATSTSTFDQVRSTITAALDVVWP
jgi:hypothetical protein